MPGMQGVLGLIPDRIWHFFLFLFHLAFFTSIGNSFAVVSFSDIVFSRLDRKFHAILGTHC